MRERMTLAKWYGNSIRVPGFSNHNFVPFVSSSVGIVNSILKSDLGLKIKIQFSTSGTAAADRDNMKILINQCYLQGRLPESPNPINSDQAITCLLGLIVHETGHFAYSPKDLKPAIEYVENNTTSSFSSEIAGCIANVVEDIYIEAELDRNFPSLIWMLEHLNELTFDQAEISQRVKKVENVKDTPTDWSQVAPIINAMIISRIDAKVKLTHYMQEIFELSLRAQFLTQIDERFALTLEIYEKVMSKLKLMPGQATAIANAIKTTLSKILGDKAAVESMEKTHSATGVISVIESNLERQEDCIIKLINSDNKEPFIETSISIEVPLVNDAPVQMDKRFSILAQIGRQLAVVNRPYGRDMIRGNHIRKLHRIATDQKIFAEPVERIGRKPIMVGILFDCSGSMRSSHVEATGMQRLQAAQQAVLGAAVALSEAQCDVAVYGHVGDSMQSNNLTILRAKAFNESISGLAQRLGNVRRQNSGGNRDGYALDFVAKKMTNTKKRRVLIVISDGLPAASGGYEGQTGINHTKKMADKARRDGIEVLSISIDQDAMDANNQIYGKDNNIFNEDPMAIEFIVAKLIGAR